MRIKNSVRKNKETKKNARAEEMRQLKELFALYDKDNSGSINKVELKLLMNSLGFYPSTEMIEKLILDNDVDGDELIDFEEFVQMAEKYKKEEITQPHKGLRDAFNVLDKDKSNTLGPDEFRATITRIGEQPLSNEEVNEIMRALNLEPGSDIPIDKVIELFSAEH